MTVKVGDLVQWTCHGADQFVEPKAIAWISECGEYCFVEGASTGIPVSQVSVQGVKVERVDSSEERFTFFWHGPFSQWYPSKFTVENITFNCAEQYMMGNKAALFDDQHIYTKIMTANNPSDQKRFGRAVRNFDAERWDAVAKKVVYVGNRHKFTDNPDLMKLLLGTAGTTLVEASPYDRIWGIGLAESDPRAKSRSTWLGTNWLGEVLTELRDDFIKNG